jgi:predicted nuclease of restriction endonuclease-like RecB superfamily
MRVVKGTIRVAYLADPDSRVIAFLDRLCRLVRRLEGRSLNIVTEALRRQERRVRDATRLAGIAKTLLDLCEFRAPDSADKAAAVRDEVFAARGRRWPPVPGDHRVPYEDAAVALDVPVSQTERLLYADSPAARTLVRAPAIGGRALLARYNLELARAVLLDAERVALTARGGWRGIFRAVKAARLMYVVSREGRSYRVEVTGPAGPFVVRTTRYGARFARLVPALARAPGWRLEADVRVGTNVVRFGTRGRPRASRGQSPVGGEARRPTYDSAWERSLASEFRRRFRAERGGWTLERESTPVTSGGAVFLPDFTLRHADGREALVELVGFWTQEYLAAKVRKIEVARLEHLVLVVYRGLAVGGAAEALEARAGAERIVWFKERPKAGEVLRVVERVARRPR